MSLTEFTTNFVVHRSIRVNLTGSLFTGFAFTLVMMDLVVCVLMLFLVSSGLLVFDVHLN